jgi:ankyrin repeat protein
MENIFGDLKNSSTESIRKMIETDFGGDANLARGDGLTLLHFAAAYADNLEVAKVLVSMGANVNAKEQTGITPLHNAARFGNVEIAKLLISKGANVNAKLFNGVTPLEVAQKRGDTAMVQYLSSVGGR